MLEVMKKNNNNYKLTPAKRTDIIVTKFEKKTEVQEDGTIITKTIPKNVNITKLVNETKKLVKRDLAQEKLNELKSIYTE